MITLPAEMMAFVQERHMASLTLVRSDGTPHVTPVGFTWDAQTGLARVITWNKSVKVRLLDRRGPLRAALCQVDGGRWCTLEGEATATADPARCAEGTDRYALRYGAPRDRGSDRRVIEIFVDHVLGSG
jgi:PPOX class probable F420-dependent enzyme